MANKKFTSNYDTAGTYVSYARPIARTQGDPLDKTGFYNNIGTAKTYAGSNDSYVGQIINVIESNGIQGYHIANEDGLLYPIKYNKQCCVGSDNENSAGWYKVASGNVSLNEDANLRFYVCNSFSKGYNGILVLHLRGSDNSINICQFGWMNRHTSLNRDHYRLVTTGNEWALFCYVSDPRWGRMHFQLLNELRRQDILSINLTLHDSRNKENVDPDDTNISTDLNLSQGSTSVNGTLTATGATTLSSTITVEGKATLKNEAAISSNATVGGTLSVTGNSTFTGTITANNDISVASNKKLTCPTIEGINSIYHAPDTKFTVGGCGDVKLFAGDKARDTAVEDNNEHINLFADGSIVIKTNLQDSGYDYSFSSGKIEASTFNAKSDARLKENFRPIESGNILDLPTYKFDYINGSKNLIGCKAQDLQKICPEIVDEGVDGYLSIQESKIVYLLLEEVKKLRKEIDELKR